MRRCKRAMVRFPETKSMSPAVVCVEKTPQSDRISVEAPWPLLEVAVCAFSKSICETVRLASRPDRPFQTIVRYDGDKQRFLSKNVVLLRPLGRRFSWTFSTSARWRRFTFEWWAPREKRPFAG